VFVDDFFGIFRFYLYIKGIVRHDLDNRTFLTETETAGSDDLYFVFQSTFFQTIFQSADDIFTG